MKINQRLYAIYGMAVFTILFAVFLPLFFIPILIPSQYRLIGMLNRWWARAAFFLWFLKLKIEIRGELNPKAQYIFCPNHFSYLDIPTMGLNPHNTIFVGKHEMKNVPVFGFMYKSLHITVNRSKLASKYDTYLKSAKALDQGKSLVIFPEGGIISENIPKMAKFKDGAFRLAIEKRISIVPVSIPNNWVILKHEPLRLRGGIIKLVIHEPIDVTGLTVKNVDQLKEQVFNVINSELENDGK